ncbi:VOC family protein [Chitinolyticbacter meiyuanensis]|uniref:VOC family protein n=1 Tax=Chitinolyticbacter meiyuanensis TaxID=682798 RepID=UPI0011E59D26|nr:VOC family protein [Chitinolyticbacter meiyuanensis]
MTQATAIEIKAFVPARDFALSRRFYSALGFQECWASDDLAYFTYGTCSFLLQRFYVAEHADNFMMHLLVDNADAWWQQVEPIAAEFGLRTVPPQDQPWGMRDFVVIDPTGVLWRIGQNLPA